MRATRLGAFQIGSSSEGTAATLERILTHTSEIKDAKLDLLVFPEALLGGYPKGADFGARVGYRTAEGREAYLRYHREAIDLDGPEVAALCELAREANTALVVGAIERAEGTLYCVALFIDAEGQFVGRHRKLMPTASERLIWGQGDGSTLTTMRTRAGLAGSAICWENYMPLFRAAMYGKGLDIWCAPTVDEREIWRASMQHIAYEARCFLVSACQVQPPSTEALGQPITLRDRPDVVPMIRGGSCIVSPMGEVIAGPLQNAEGLVTTEVDLDDIVRPPRPRRHRPLCPARRLPPAGRRRLKALPSATVWVRSPCLRGNAATSAEGRVPASFFHVSKARLQPHAPRSPEIPEPCTIFPRAGPDPPDFPAGLGVPDFEHGTWC